MARRRLGVTIIGNCCLRVFSLWSRLSGYTAAFREEINTAEQWEDKQRVKAPLRENNGMGTMV